MDAAADSGVQFEGTQPKQTHADGVAFRVYSLLANGMGGLDWGGLPMVCAWIGAEDDMDGLMYRLAVIKEHGARNGRDDETTEAAQAAKD